MEKDGFGKVANDDKPDVTEILTDATAFLTQYSKEYSTAYDNVEGGIDGRLKQVKEEIETTGTYVQTFDELQYGCRLAWRNSGRCIMRKVCRNMSILFVIICIISFNVPSAYHMYHIICHLITLSFRHTLGFIHLGIVRLP